MSRQTCHFLNAILALSVFIPVLLTSCKKNSTAQQTEESSEIVSELPEEKSAEEKKIIVPPGIPSEAILDFKAPDIPERKRNSKDLPPIPSAPESVKAIKACREEYNEENNVRKFYDDKDRLFLEDFSDGTKRWTEYTDKGSKIYQDSGSYMFYQENDGHGNEIYFLSKSQERFTENIYDGDSCTSFCWNYIFREDSEVLEKTWRKSEGETLLSYSVGTNSENDRKEESWLAVTENKPLYLEINSRHTRITQKNFFREYWEIIESNKLHPETGIYWYWDERGISYKKTTTVAGEIYNERKEYISSFTEETDGKKQWEESINSKDFMSRNISSNDGSLKRTLNYEDKYQIEINRNDSFTKVSFIDRETGKEYSVYTTQDETSTDILDEKTKKQSTYRAYYDNDSRVSSHHKADWSSGELEWVPVYKVPEVNSDK